MKEFMAMFESLARDETVPELIMSMYQLGAMTLNMAQALAEWTSAAEDWSQYVKA